LKLLTAEKRLMSRNREKAFVSSEFKDYNPRVEYHVSKFIEVIRKTGGKEVNVEKLLENLVFDM
jgi:hypothetical protein